MRLLVASLTLFLSLIAVAPAIAQVVPATNPTDYQTYTLANTPEVAVRFVVKQDASLADSDFLRLEFENKTNQPIDLGSGGWTVYWSNYDSFDLLTNKPLVSYLLLGQATDRDLLGTKPRSIYTTLSPGTIVNSHYPSMLAATSLGLGSANGELIKATISFQFRVKSGVDLTPEANQKVEFRWHRPDANGMAQLRNRLRIIFSGTQGIDLASSYLAHTLIKIPEIAAAFSTNELLKDLDQNTDPFSARSAILYCLDHDHSKEPAVTQYFAMRLAANDAKVVRQVLDDLRNMESVWDDDFIPHLVAISNTTQYQYDDPLRLLDWHSQAWSQDVKIRESLSQHLLATYPGLKEGNESFGSGESIEWLGLTHDPKMIPVLARLLSSKTVLEYRDFRVCDCAYNAICHIQGRLKDEMPDPYVNGGSGFTGPIPNDQLVQRDALIAQMLKMLQAK